jgi:hypothetical protein
VFPISHHPQVILFLADFLADLLPPETKAPVSVRCGSAIQAIYIVLRSSPEEFRIHGIPFIDQQDF